MSDTKALIERLRAFVALDGGDLAVVEQAADTIARLEAERDAARGTARRIMGAERATADAARREAMEEAVRICSAVSAELEAKGSEWHDAAEGADDCVFAIRAAMQGEGK